MRVVIAIGETLCNSSTLMSDAGSLISEWSRKLAVLEAFSGQYFFNLPEDKNQTDGANDSLWECAA